jgi:hypothetical protein
MAKIAQNCLKLPEKEIKMTKQDVNFFDVADDFDLPHDKEIHTMMLCQKHANKLDGNVWFMSDGDIDCYCQYPDCKENNRDSR